MSKSRKAKVLLVEDSPSDQVVIQRAIEDGNIHFELTIAKNGAVALSMLLNEPPFDDTLGYPQPSLVFMDINMPILDGKQTLQAIRNNPALAHIPVIMLTTSDRDKDVMDSYRMGANAFITKPVEIKTFIETFKQLEQFWCKLVTLPNFENL